jgi:hypothetical protein
MILRRISKFLHTFAFVIETRRGACPAGSFDVAFTARAGKVGIEQYRGEICYID